MSNLFFKLRWICRKGFAAINMQATVDHRGKFFEYSLRPGSCSDKNVWKMSSLGQCVDFLIPEGYHLLGDAGYTLNDNLLIPYTIYEGMPQDEKDYNYLHSCSRIVIERAFGLLKGRWRILKRALNMKKPETAAQTIVACLILHNLTMDFGDRVALSQTDCTDPHLGWHRRARSEGHRVRREAEIAKRDAIKEYLVTIKASRRVRQ